MAIVKSKLLKKIKSNYPNFLKKDLDKFTDIILEEIKLALKRGDRVELRGFGIKNKILILSRIEPEWLSKALKFDLSINISNLYDFKIISKFYKKKKNCPSFHLKFDTGMTRLGFDKKDIKKVIYFLLNNKNLPLEGIYSHFATADEGELSFAYNQLRIFNKIKPYSLVQG